MDELISDEGKLEMPGERQKTGCRLQGSGYEPADGKNNLFSASSSGLAKGILANTLRGFQGCLSAKVIRWLHAW